MKSVLQAGADEHVPQQGVWLSPCVLTWLQPAGGGPAWGRISGGAQRHTGEAVTSKKLPLVLLPLSPYDLLRVASSCAAATGASLCLHLTLSSCPCALSIRGVCCHMPHNARLGCPEGAGRESRSKQAHSHVSSACLCSVILLYNSEAVRLQKSPQHCQSSLLTTFIADSGLLSHLPLPHPLPFQGCCETGHVSPCLCFHR